MTSEVFHDSHAARLRAVEGLPLATFPARAMALAVDGLLLLALLLLVRLPWAVSGAQSGTLTFVFDVERIWDLLAIVAYFGLFTWLMGGQTPGKRLLRIRVVSVTHDRLTPWQCIERALGYVASTLELGFGFYQYYLDPNRQTVHDRIAGTIVVKASATSRPAEAQPPAVTAVRPHRGKRRRHRRKH